MSADTTENAENKPNKSKVLLIPIRILIALTVILWVTSLFFYAVLVVSKTSSEYGLIYNIEGTSMNPTIDENCTLVVDYTPFEQLQVGDIISYKMNKTHEARMSYQNQSNKPFVEKNMTIPPHSVVKNPAYDKDVDIKYLEDTNVVHRIIEIREADENYDRALFTQGDNCPERDFRSIMKSGYNCKVIYIIPFGGKLLGMLYVRKGIYGIFAATMICTFLTLVMIGKRLGKLEKMAANTNVAIN